LKNADQARDPDMHQTKKGNQWYFGMKAHVGVDSRTKLIHTVVATAANVADSAVLADLLHGEETRVWGDQAYRGQTDVIKEHAPDALDFTNRRYRHRGVVGQERRKNRAKSSVRSRVEHVIGVIKRVFGFAKVRYRGLDKNADRLFVTGALAPAGVESLVSPKMIRSALHATPTTSSSDFSRSWDDPIRPQFILAQTFLLSKLGKPQAQSTT
jgi:IS5 family transposase